MSSDALLYIQEIEMLSHAASLPEEQRHQPLQPPPADLLRSLQLAASNLETRRQQVRASVFQPSHNLPTRTLREQAHTH